MHELDAEVTIDPIRAQLAPYAMLIKLGVALVCALALFIGGCNHGAAKWETKYNDEVRAHTDDNIEWEAIVEGIAERTRKAESAAKLASEQAAAERKANDKRFEEKSNEADKARDALAAALRNGSARLRPEWACPASRPAEGGAATAAGRQDGDAELRATREGSVLDSIDDGKLADRWIIWLQAELIATRMACGVPP